MRRILAAFGLVTVLALAGCGSAGQQPVATAEPAVEALWLTDESGAVRAYTGWTDQPAARIDLGPAPGGWQLVGGGAALWAFSPAGRLVRIDPAAARVTVDRQITAGDGVLYRTGDTAWVRQQGNLWRFGPDAVPTPVVLPGGAGVTAVTTDERGLWAAGADARLYRVAAADATIAAVGAPALAAGVTALAAGPYGIVLATPTGVTALDPSTGTQRWTLPLPGPVTRSGPVALYGTSDTVWAANSGATVRMRPGAVLSGPGGSPGVIGPDSLWLGDVANRELVRIPLAGDDPVSRATLTFGTGESAGPGLVLTLAAGHESVWVADSERGTGLSRVDPGSNRVVRLFPQQGTARRVAAVVADPPV